MNNYKKLVIGAAISWLLAGLVTESSAQRRPNTHFVPYSSVTFGVGTSTYFGELNPYSYPLKSLFTLPRWNVGLGYTRQFTPHFAARAMFTWARITGDDYTFSKSNPEKYALNYIRNLHFRNDLKEFAITGIYNFIADGRNSDVRAKFTPYLFGGLALLAHSPEAKTPTSADSASRQYAPGTWVKLQPLHTEGQGQPGYAKPYSLVTIAIPVGIGARYRLNESFNIGAEIGFRMSFTAYLDDVGGTYATPDAVQGLGAIMADRRNEPDAARANVSRTATLQALHQNADPTLFTTGARGGGTNKFPKDGYLLTNFSIQYIIPVKIKCPPIK